MGYAVIAEGTDVTSLTSLQDYESEFEEGQKGELRLFTNGIVPDWAIGTLQTGLKTAGVELWDDVKQDSRMIYIRFRKAIPPLAIIAIALAAVIVLIGAVLAWQLYKITEASPALIVPIMLGVGAILAVTIFQISKRYSPKGGG